MSQKLSADGLKGVKRTNLTGELIMKIVMLDI